MPYQQQQTSMEVLLVAMKAAGVLLNLLTMEVLLEVELRDWRVHKVVGRCLYLSCHDAAVLVVPPTKKKKKKQEGSLFSLDSYFSSIFR